MNTKYMIIWIVLLLTSFASAAPVARWNFDECSGPTAADIVGSSDLALTNGVAWTTDARSGCAVRLDGANDYLRDGEGPIGMTEIRLEAWIKRDSLQDGMIISRNGPYYLAIRNNVLAAGIFHGGGPEGWDEMVGTTPLQVGQWYHIAMSYNRTDLKVFLNDREDNSIRRPGSIYWDGHTLFLGWGEPGQNQFFHGTIDDAVIYNAANNSPSPPSLNITNIGGTSVSPLFRTPTNPFALQFTFQPNQNYPVPNIPPETIVGNLTLTAPFFASQPYYLRYYIELREFNTPLYYAFENFGFMPRMLFATLHFDEITSFYLMANQNAMATVPVVKASLDVPYYVQALAYNGNEFVLSDGYKVIVPLPSTQPPSGLPREYAPDNFTAALWHFDEGAGAIVYDETTNNNDGMLQNGASFVSPAPIQGSDYAIAFDGVDDYILVPDSASLDVTNAFTLEAWIKLDGLQRYPIIGKWNDNNVTDRHWAYLMEFNNNKLRLTIGRNQQWDYLFGDTTLEVSRWYHVAATFDNGRMRVYVNGRLDGEKNSTISAVSILDEPLRIGYAYMNDFEHLYFDGIIDEVRISNKARNPLEFHVP